ncbi:MAG: M20/M25/M40 family metallo-hydrolase [Acidobacteria bacterium]|nr:M20/M25/M40 family metallo-hydrolase [Acidobacteriota bacterium]
MIPEHSESRRAFLKGALAAGAVGAAMAAPGDADSVKAEVEKHHDANVRRLQTWIRQPSIAAENRGMNEGCALMMSMLGEAGFEAVTRVASSGQPGVFATLDAGASRTFGIYFMYDVKQADPAEWMSPPFDAAILDRAGLGKVLVGRGAVNQKGPQATLLAALNAFREAGRKPPVNLVFIAEGEEEIGSPHFSEIVQRPEVLAAFRKCEGIFMPMPMQSLDGTVTINLGAKGVIEVELIASGEKWGRGPKADVHSSLEAVVDSPAWRLIQALNTLVAADGHTPAIEGFADRARPLSADEKAMIRAAAAKQSEAVAMRGLGVEHWVHNVDWLESRELLAGRPTVNIEGLVGGYTGPGGKTILPHRAVAKLDLRLVPDMTAAGALAALKAHLTKKGFGDVEVKMSGGYDPTSTPKDSSVVKAAQTAYRQVGLDAVLWPRLAGSWPGYVFTGAPLKLPATHFGMGFGSGAHAPNEFYVIESANRNVVGFDAAARSYVDYLYALAAA